MSSHQTGYDDGIVREGVVAERQLVRLPLW